jgi:replicative DNA helicase
MNPVQELNKVASSVANFNEKLATAIYSVAEEVHDLKLEKRALAKETFEFKSEEKAQEFVKKINELGKNKWARDIEFDGNKVMLNIMASSYDGDVSKVIQIAQRMNAKIAQIITDDEETGTKIVDKIDETSDMIEDIQDQLDEVIDELDNIATDAEDTSEKIAKKADAKSVGLFQEGDTIVLSGSPVQGVYEGRLYLAGPEIEPGYILIKEMDGTDVGVFKKERFNLDTKSY